MAYRLKLSGNYLIVNDDNDNELHRAPRSTVLHGFKNSSLKLYHNPIANEGRWSINGAEADFVDEAGSAISGGAAAWLASNTGFNTALGGSGAEGVYFASEYGLVSDADVSLGSTTFGTDNITVAQNLLNEAQTKPILIYWDVKSSVSGVLSVYSNTTIIGLSGCGLILRNASNSYLLKNANTAKPIAPYDNANITDENIVIENMILNGNGYNTGTGGNTVFDVANNGSAVNGSAQTKRNQILDFTGVKNFKLNNIQLLGGRYWASHFSNVVDGHIENLLVDFGDSSTRDDYNYDGVHFKGGTNRIRMKGITVLNAKDDNIAFNSYAQLSIYEDERGPIKNVYLDGIYVDSRSMGIGIYSETTPSLIDNIFVKNYTGYTQSHAVRITNGETVSPDGDGIMKNIIFENVNVQVTGASVLGNDSGLFNIRGNIDNLTLRNLIRSDFTKSQPLISFSDAEAVVKQFILDGVQQITAGGTFTQPILEVSDGSIKQCHISNVQHIEETSSIDAPIVLVNGGDIETLILDKITTDKLDSIFKHTSGSVSNIIGDNIQQINPGSDAFITSGTVASIHLSNFSGNSNMLNGTFTKKRGSSLDYLGELLFVNLPPASDYPGSMVSITDETNGYGRAYSDATNWILFDGTTADGPTLSVLLSHDFTGTSVDTGVGTITNPNSSDLTISQNNKLLFTRTTDNTVAGSTTDGWQTVSSYPKGGAVSVLVNKDIGFAAGVCSVRWIFNGTIDFIGMQRATGSNNWRIIIKSSNSIVYDFDTTVSTSNRVKITYDSSNNIKFWYWNTSVWTQMGSTQVYNIGTTGTILLSSNSDANDAVNDVLSFDQIRATDEDYSTELPD